MKVALITKNPVYGQLAREAEDEERKFVLFEDWREAFEHAAECDLMIADLISLLEKPHRIEGYRKFGEARLAHPIAARVPLVLIPAPDGYKLDGMIGWPNFLLGQLRHPITRETFRQVLRWI